MALTGLLLISTWGCGEVLKNLESIPTALGSMNEIVLITDIITLQQHRQALVDRRLIKANSQRTRHEYKVGEFVYIDNKNTAAHKLKPIYSGPFPILQVHTNNTVTVQRDNHVVERLSIRRLKPASKAQIQTP